MEVPAVAGRVEGLESCHGLELPPNKGRTVNPLPNDVARCNGVDVIDEIASFLRPHGQCLGCRRREWVQRIWEPDDEPARIVWLSQVPEWNADGTCPMSMPISQE